MHEGKLMIIQMF